MKKSLLLLSCCLLLHFSTQSQKKETKPVVVKDEKKDEVPLLGITFRNIGPAVTSGRIADVAVNPNNIYEYYVASASGGVWKPPMRALPTSPSLMARVLILLAA